MEYSEYYKTKIGGDYIQTVSVAVPSRLRGNVGSETPLAEWRIAVKDIFAIQL